MFIVFSLWHYYHTNIYLNPVWHAISQWSSGTIRAYLSWTWAHCSLWIIFLPLDPKMASFTVPVALIGFKSSSVFCRAWSNISWVIYNSGLVILKLIVISYQLHIPLNYTFLLCLSRIIHFSFANDTRVLFCENHRKTWARQEALVSFFRSYLKLPLVFMHRSASRSEDWYFFGCFCAHKIWTNVNGAIELLLQH